MTPIKKIAAATLALVLATSVGAGNSNKDKANNGNQNGQVKKTVVQVPASTTSVPEPATLGLAAAGALTAGIVVWRRRRQK